MKKFKIITIAILCLTPLFNSCSSDDDNNPVPVNEEEVITTLTATFTPSGNGTNVVLTSRDLDGDGPNDPVITVLGKFMANTNYTGAVVVLNETETPAENITEEVNAEAEEHQFFYITSGGLNLSFTYANFDADNNPLGTLYNAQAGDASSGNLNIVLRHEPKKPNDGTLGDAGGETDISVSFPIEIE